jgi:hypothetical protein
MCGCDRESQARSLRQEGRAAALLSVGDLDCGCLRGTRQPRSEFVIGATMRRLLTRCDFC